MTAGADLNGPVGYDKHGYSYRSAGGEKFHDAKLEAYGKAYGEGAVVGMYLLLGEQHAGGSKQQHVRAHGTLPRLPRR